jgi:arylsulfatase A-like enzyme
MTTPFGDALVLDFALELIRAEELGKRGALDVISISLSANDAVGHTYGPDSVESKELAYSLDREMARLLRFLDEAVGAGHYALVLTSDHGVGYSPEAVSASGYGAKRYSYTEMARQVRKRISIDHKYLEWDSGFAAGGFYFDPECLARGGVAPELLERTAAEVLRGTRGIMAAYTRGEILGGKLPETELVRSIRAAYNADRSPDVYVVPEPYWIEGTGTASHGTPHAYDAHVPLVFYGGGLEPRRVPRPVSMRSLAPTITAILGCTPPSACQAEPLREIVDGIGRKPVRG